MLALSFFTCLLKMKFEVESLNIIVLSVYYTFKSLGDNQPRRKVFPGTCMKYRKFVYENGSVTKFRIFLN